MAETRVRIPVAVLGSPRVYGAFRVLGVLKASMKASQQVGRFLGFHELPGSTLRADLQLLARHDGCIALRERA